MEKISERIGWLAKWRIDRWSDPDGFVAAQLQGGISTDQLRHRCPERYLGFDEWNANVALNEGLQLLIDLIAGTGTGNPWSNSYAYLGVGDGTTAEDATQTGLQGANKTYKAMDAGYPQRSGQSCEWRATFGASDANYNWQEFTIANGNSDTAVNLNRKVANKGTKSSGETWTLSLTITFS